MVPSFEWAAEYVMGKQKLHFANSDLGCSKWILEPVVDPLGLGGFALSTCLNLAIVIYKE